MVLWRLITFSNLSSGAVYWNSARSGARSNSAATTAPSDTRSPQTGPRFHLRPKRRFVPRRLKVQQPPSLQQSRKPPASRETAAATAASPPLRMMTSERPDTEKQVGMGKTKGPAVESPDNTYPDTFFDSIVVSDESPSSSCLGKHERPGEAPVELVVEPTTKRRRGRPKGSKDSRPRRPRRDIIPLLGRSMPDEQRAMFTSENPSMGAEAPYQPSYPVPWQQPSQPSLHMPGQTGGPVGKGQLYMPTVGATLEAPPYKQMRANAMVPDGALDRWSSSQQAMRQAQMTTASAYSQAPNGAPSLAPKARMQQQWKQPPAQPSQQMIVPQLQTPAQPEAMFQSGPGPPARFNAKSLGRVVCEMKRPSSRSRPALDLPTVSQWREYSGEPDSMMYSSMTPSPSSAASTVAADLGNDNVFDSPGAINPKMNGLANFRMGFQGTSVASFPSAQHGRSTLHHNSLAPPVDLAPLNTLQPPNSLTIDGQLPPNDLNHHSYRSLFSGSDQSPRLHTGDHRANQDMSGNFRARTSATVSQPLNKLYRRPSSTSSMPRFDPHPQTSSSGYDVHDESLYSATPQQPQPRQYTHAPNGNHMMVTDPAPSRSHGKMAEMAHPQFQANGPTYLPETSPESDGPRSDFFPAPSAPANNPLTMITSFEDFWDEDYPNFR